MTSMKIDRIERGLHFAAYGMLVLVALLVPLIDRQPLNAMAALFAIMVTILLALWGRQCMRAWDAIDWTILALLVSAILSTFFGWPGAGRYQGIAEAVSHLTLFLYLRHGRHDETALQWMAAAVIAGTTIAAMLTFVSHAPGLPFQLPGVRGSIRSALYTGITLMLCLGLALHNRSMRRYVTLGLVLFLAVMVLSMASRAVTLGLWICLLIGFIASYRWSAPKYVLISAIAVGIATSLMPRTAVDQSNSKATELVELVEEGKISTNDQSRIEIWRVAWTWIRQGEHVLLGIGPRNFFLIDQDRLELDPPIQFEQTRQSAHAHNLFLTRYIEQGLFGVLTLLALLALIARRLLLDAIQRRTGWAWWAALGGWWLPLISGLVGSPWNHEYAWLAVLTFAIYLAPKPSKSFRY